MFFLKKLLPCFLFPVPVCAGFLLLGLGVWNFTRWKRTGRGLVITGTVLLLAFSYPWLPRLALRHLEARYPAVLGVSGQWSVGSSQKTGDGGTAGGLRGTSNNQHPTSNIEGGGIPVDSGGRQKGEDGAPSFIMVLSASGLSADTNRPPAARLSDESLQRLLEGVRLHRLFPNTTLLVSVSGSAVPDEEKIRVLRELLLIFGMATNAVQVCATARDTEDEVVWCRQVVTTNRVILVSSASHLPRAMVLAHRHSVNAVPAPSGYLVDTVTPSVFSPGHLFPSAGNLQNSERALHEYLGLLWEAVRGQKAEDGGR